MLRLRLWALVFSVFGLLTSFSAPARADGTAPTVVVQWDNAVLQAIRDIHPAPPVCARALAIVHTAMYDAWAAYDPVAVGTRLGGNLRRPPWEETEANKDRAISVAAYRALADLFPQPAEVALFQARMTALGYDWRDTSTDTTTPTGIGNVAAQAVLDFRHHDGSNQLGDLHPGAYSDYIGYVPVNTPDRINDPSRWQPLRVPDGKGGFTVQQCAVPCWGLVIPFALPDGAAFRPTFPPVRYGSVDYKLQADQILQFSARLTDRAKVVAEYWADGPKSETPPGHWCLFGQFVSQRDHHGVDADVKMFFALSNAVFDAGIAAWDTKMAYDSVRPITAIHYLYKGKKVLAWAGPYQGTQWIKGEDWQPYQAANVVTPAFPEYISGHSTFSAAAAQVLRSFTGGDAFGASFTRPAGGSVFEPGRVPATDVTLSWPTFTAAADEAGLSRRYGGIHFEQGDLVGRAVGHIVGIVAWNKAQSYFDGTAGLYDWGGDL